MEELSSLDNIENHVLEKYKLYALTGFLFVLRWRNFIEEGKLLREDPESTAAALILPTDKSAAMGQDITKTPHHFFWFYFICLVELSCLFFLRHFAVWTILSPSFSFWDYGTAAKEVQNFFNIRFKMLLSIFMTHMIYTGCQNF